MDVAASATNGSKELSFFLGQMICSRDTTSPHLTTCLRLLIHDQNSKRCEENSLSLSPCRCPLAMRIPCSAIPSLSCKMMYTSVYISTILEILSNNIGINRNVREFRNTLRMFLSFPWIVYIWRNQRRVSCIFESDVSHSKLYVVGHIEQYKRAYFPNNS